MKQKRTLLFSITMILMLLSSLVFQVTPAQAAPLSAGAADDHTVLILSTTSSNGVESAQATALGFTVEMADATQWGAKSTADFATYRALILGDARCSGQSIYAAALANRTTWSPAINGNIMLIGGDPGYHANASPQDKAKQEIRQSIGFAADQVGMTGLYFAFGCAWSSGGNVNVLDQFGTFTMRGQGWEAVHKVADHPALAGLDDAALSNWSTSTHAGFTAFPSGWTPVAIMDGLTGAGDLTFTDGHHGVPYMLGQGTGLVVPGGPTITGISPTDGPTSGGTIVTITGTNFTGFTSVTLGHNAMTCTGPNTATTLTNCTTPAHAAGAVTASVTTPIGTGTGGTFTYSLTASPTITGLTPIAGPTAGGTSVTITGTDLTGFTSVTFGGSSATCPGPNTATSLVCTTPAHAAGLVDVAVTTPGGTATATGAYTFVPPPTITGVSPSAGPTAGGTSVTITGTNLTGATAVTFGGTAATLASCTIAATSITCPTPAHAAGLVDVAVTTPSGTATATGAFTFVPPPTITGVSPSAGPTTGGQTVTITGTNLAGGTFTFGGSAAVCTVNGAGTQATCTTPAHVAGLVDVAVTTAGGTATSTGAYTFVPPPTIAGVSPSAGPTTGGTSVTITENNLTGGTFTFGGTAAVCTVNGAGTQATCITPAHAAGLVDVVVTTLGGTSTLPNSFTFVPPPTITGIDPNKGPISGGQTVTITGTNLTGFSSVTFGGTAATCPGPNTATSLICTTPAHIAGTVDVAVTTVGGTGTMTNAYTFVPPPTIVSVSPNRGPVAGGTVVTISGANLTGAGFSFGGIAADCSINAEGNQATCTTPAHIVGLVNVVVSSWGGNMTLSNVYSYVYGATLPSTGFAPGRITALPPQSVSYADLGDLWLEIPKLGVQIPIVGIPQSANGEWDVSWLGNDAGWLNGTAFPTWAGNSVLTGHVWNADNTAGPFANLNQLWYGDKVIVHAWGGQYVYEVRSVLQVSPWSTGAMMKHQELPWLTLVSCRGYDETSDTYKYRVLVRAVLMEAK
jgi:LPXTG-site transpeptidase (sortase) family protein